MVYAKILWQAKLAFYQEKALSTELHLKHGMDITCFLSGKEHGLFFTNYHDNVLQLTG